MTVCRCNIRNGVSVEPVRLQVVAPDTTTAERCHESAQEQDGKRKTERNKCLPPSQVGESHRILLLREYIFSAHGVPKRRSSKPVSKDREECVNSYLKQHPEAPPLQIIGAYNSHRELGDQWGYFSLREMERVVAKIKSDQV